MTAALSVQLYSVRDVLAADLPNVERFGFVDRVDEYRAALANAGLTALSGHASLVDPAEYGDPARLPSAPMGPDGSHPLTAAETT